MKKVILLLLIVTAIFIHWHRASRDKQYFGKITGFQTEQSRDFRYDWLRVLAAAMVILTHAMQYDVGSGFVQGNNQLYMMKVFYTLFMTCNCIYVMLMGALLLPYKEESLSSFYVRRMSRVVLPMIIYFVFYLWQNKELTKIDMGTPGWILGRLYMRDVPETPHYWLIYTILGLYLITPFLRYMMKHISYQVLTWLVALSFIYLYLEVFIPVPFGIPFLFGPWIGIAATGYWMIRPETRRYDKWLMAAGLIAVALLMVIVKRREDFLEVCANGSPIAVAIACGLFSCICLFRSFFGRQNRIIGMLSYFSYSVILIHWWGLNWVTIKTFHIHTSLYGYLGGTLLSLGVTFAVSLVAAFLIDNTVVVVADAALQFVVKTVRKGIGAVRGISIMKE